MRRIFNLSVLCLAAGIASACRPDEVVKTEDIPTAGVRFINAVPDTLALDFRFVDIVESNAHFRVGFRNAPATSLGVTASTQVQYKAAKVGTRNYRIFLNDTLQSVASFVVREGTMTIEAGKNYTVLLWGYADPAGLNRPLGAPAMVLDIYEEVVTVPSGQIGLRAINATMTALDVSAFAWNGAAPAPPTWDDIAAMSRSGFVNVVPDTQLFRVQPSTGGAALFADSRALVGTPAVTIAPGPYDATPGTTVAGSAVTAIVFPGSVACSKAPQTSAFQFTTTPTVVLSATATGYARTTGSFITDAIPVNATIGVCGFTQPENNGLAFVTARTATTLTVTKTGGTRLEAGTTGNTTGNISATATGYARTTGSFVTDGFVVGMTVAASGFTQTANNGNSVITAVTAGALTTTKTPTTILEAATTGSTTLGATATGYNRTAGSFVTDGWVVGQSVTASGFATAANNGTSSITAVTATDLTVTKVGGTVVEAAAAGRTIASAATRAIANATLRQIAAERPILSFIWDVRPPRPPGI